MNASWDQGAKFGASLVGGAGASLVGGAGPLWLMGLADLVVLIEAMDVVETLRWCSVVASEDIEVPDRTRLEEGSTIVV